MGDTLESSAVKLAGLVAFQVLPCLARVNESLSWVTATSVSSSLLRLHMVLSRKSMGRLFKRSMLNFLTRKTCGLSASLTYQSSSPFFLPTRAVCCLPFFRLTVTVSSGVSRPVSSGLALSAKSLAFQVPSREAMPLATLLSKGSTFTEDSTTCHSGAGPASRGAGLGSTIFAPFLLVTCSFSASFSSKLVMVLSRQAVVSLSNWYLKRPEVDHTSSLPSRRIMVI